MTSKRALLSILFISVMSFLAFVPKDDDPLDRLVAALQKWTAVHSPEKVYLHMDKSYYILGDTIWFKGYVTVGSRHQLSAQSGALYVDLITEKDSIVKSLKLPVTAGMVMGDFSLDGDLNAGNYRIKAYTQWMRNAGDTYFFDRTFSVGTTISRNVITTAHYEYKSVDGQEILTALLNYTDEEGKLLSDKNVSYELIIDKKRTIAKSGKTDAKGNLSVVINNEKQADLRGDYIRTTIETDVDGTKSKVIKDFPIKAGLAQSDVQFFPESGNLVSEVLSRVAFKATGVDGVGLMVKGVIIDNEQKQVASIETLRAGMGSFMMRPEPTKSYTAKIRFEDGSERIVPLPKAVEEGYVLSVYQPNRDSILVRISVSSKTLAAANGTPLLLKFIAQTGGEIVTTSTVNITRQITSFWLQKKSFPSGIAQFTIFNSDGVPLNERVAFIKTKDHMQLTLATAKQSYKGRERVDVELIALDKNEKPITGNFSVSVIDVDKAPVREDAEHTIFSDLLLTLDLQGYVEKPNYYFREETDDVNRALDNLMLTQGYRRFTWKDLSGADTSYMTPPKFQKEGLGINITGVVRALNAKPSPNAKVTLMASTAGILESAITDANGRFKFEGLVLRDSIKFAVQARTAKNGAKLEVTLDSLPKIFVGRNKNIGDVDVKIAGSLKVYLENGKKQEEMYERTGQLSRTQKLREVQISAKKRPEQALTEQGPVRILEGHADKTVNMENEKVYANLGIMLRTLLPNIKFLPFTPDPFGPTIQEYPHVYNSISQKSGPMNIVLDGRTLDPVNAGGVFDNTTLDPADIARVDVVRDNAALIGMLGGPTLLIYTKRDKRKVYDPSVVNFSPKGLNQARVFYSPKYAVQNSSAIAADLRSTIYWNPSVKTYSTGKTSFNFFNADGPGNYKVIVEGINAEGELGRAVYHYRVEEENVTPKAQVVPVAANAITRSLDTLRKRLPIEKIYLHTDKPYYLVGDTIWFKAYLTSGSNNQPSALSGTLYVDLINEADSIWQTKKLVINAGMANGDFVLDDSTTKEGNYRIRAYTQWMRNAGPDYFYDHTFSVGNSVGNSLFGNVSYLFEKDGSKTKIKAKLKYTDDKGNPQASKEVSYNLKESYATLASGTGRTNEAGELIINLPTLKNELLRKAYLSTILSFNKDQRAPKTFPIKFAASESDVQFFPESGALINGVKSKIAFKAVGTDGLAVGITGSIVDNDNQTVAELKTMHLGMGYFYLPPQLGKTYKANVTFLNGDKRSYELQKAADNGYSLAIAHQGNDSIAVVVSTGAPNFKVNEKLVLVGQTNATATFTKDILMLKPSTIVSFSVRDLPSGIMQFTLFSSAHQPLNERIIFLQNKDTLALVVSDTKEVYKQREQVGFQLESKEGADNTVAGNFSISVISETAVPSRPEKEHSIFSDLLLVSDLKGYIEQPNYYFSNASDTTKAHLDLLMLTQGYRRFVWKQVIAGKFDNPDHQVEKIANRLTGTLTTLGNKPLAGGKVTLFSNKNGLLLNTTTNQRGKYSFDHLSMPDGIAFTTQGRSTSGGKSLNNVIDKVSAQEVTANPNIGDINSDIPQLLKASLETAKAQDIAVGKSGGKSRSQQLREVQITAVKKWGFGNEISESQADQVFRPDARTPCTTLRECLIEMDNNSSVSFKQKLDSSEMKCGMLNVPVDRRGDQYVVLIDNMLIEPCDYQEFLLSDPMGVDKILFSHTSAAIRARLLTGKLMRLPGLSPPLVIAIYTKSGNFRNRYDPSMAFYSPKGYDLSKEFYTPKYEVDQATQIADLRSTVYWNPAVLTSAGGRTRISYFNGDQLGKYRVTIEGITSSGLLGRKVFRYEVIPGVVE